MLFSNIFLHVFESLQWVVKLSFGFAFRLEFIAQYSLNSSASHPVAQKLAVHYLSVDTVNVERLIMNID